MARSTLRYVLPFTGLLLMAPMTVSAQTIVCETPNPEFIGAQTICKVQPTTPYLGLGPAGYALGYELFGRKRDEERLRAIHEAIRQGKTCLQLGNTIVCE